MDIPKSAGGGKTPPPKRSEPKDDPKGGAKKPADSKAAKNAPEATKAAASNAFGGVPKGQNAKNSDAPKSAPGTPKNSPDAPKDTAASPKNSPDAPKDAADAPKTAPEAPKNAPAAPKDASAPPNNTPPAKEPAAPAAAPDTTPATPNANLPPSAPPSDPKAGKPETPLVDTEVDNALNTPGANGKTAADEATARTMADLKKHAELLKLSGQPDDAVSRYYKMKQAESLAKLGIPTGPDPKDPTLPAKAGTEGESATSDIFDLNKIAEGLKAAENDPEVQAWLSRQQVYNLERVLDERIQSGETADIAKDPVTGLRSDYLKDKQAAYLKTSDIAKTIAALPPDKIPEAIAKATTPFGSLGVTTKDTKEQVVNLVDKVSDITGAPKPLVDSNFDPVKTAEGNFVIKDPLTGKGVAVDKDGKAITDPNTTLPVAVGIDGKPLVDPQNRPVVITRGGYTAVQNNDGSLQVVGTDKYGNENIPLTNPDNTLNRIIIDKQTDLPVEMDAKSGLPLTDAQTGLPKVVDAKTGKSLTNPANGNAVVADKETGVAVEVDYASGKIVADGEGNPLVVDPATGYQVWDKDRNPVVVDKATRIPFSTDAKTGLRTIADPRSGKPLLDPAKGTTAIFDPETKLPIAAITNKDTGEIIKNPNGQIAQLDDATGLPVVIDPKSGDKRIVDPNNGYVVLDPKGNELFVDKASGLPTARDAQGKDVVEERTRAKLIYDPKTGMPIGSNEAGTVLAIDPRSNLPVEVDVVTRGAYTKDANGNVVVMDPRTGKQQMTTDGKGVVIDPKSNQPVTPIDGKNIIVNPTTGAYVTDGETGAKVMVDPASGAAVYQDPATGDPYKDPATDGYQIVDARTGDPLKDVDGSVIQIDPKTGAPAVWNAKDGAFTPTAPLPVPVTGADGTTVTNADGNLVAKDGLTGNTILLDPATKQPIDGPAPGMRQLVDQSGNPIKDAGGNFVVQDKQSGVPVALDAKGNPIVDAKNNTLVYNLQGKQVTDANGNPVVIDKNSGAPILSAKDTGEPLVDKAGNVYVANAKTGGAIIDAETGNVVVLDKESNAPVVAGADGKVYKDAGGNAYLADLDTGKARRDAAGNAIKVDKNVGAPMVIDPKTGNKIMVGNDGEPIKEPRTGAVFEIGKNGLPQLVLDKENGERIIIDPKTGKQMEIDGNKVYIDPKTGLSVMNHPVYGEIDIVSQMAPEAAVDGKQPYSERVSEIYKMVRASIGGAYWTTFTVVGAPYSLFKDDPFFKNTKNFHASRMVNSAVGLANIVMTSLRWAPGTEMYEKMKSGDTDAILDFAMDVGSNLRYVGFYPKTAEAFVKYFAGDPVIGKTGVKVALDNKTIYKTNPGGDASIFVPKGEVNPFTGVKAEIGGWVQAPAGAFNPVDGVVNPMTERAPGAVRPSADPLIPGFERWDAQTGKWINVGSKPDGLPPGVTDPNYFSNRPPPKPTPTFYGKLAASKLFDVLKRALTFTAGAANVGLGGLQAVQGILQINDAVKANNVVEGVAGGLNLFAGGAYMAAGGGIMLSALGVAGATAGAVAGVGLAIGNILSLIAIIVEAYSNPEANKSQASQWADKVLNELNGIDVLAPDAKAKLEEWFRKFALPYYHAKEQERIKDEFGDTSALSGIPKKAA